MAKTQPQSFEDLYERLQATLRKLEEGNLPLDQAIALFEEGSKLADDCRRLLGDAELRVRKIEEEFAAANGVQEAPGEYIADEPPPDDDDLPF